MSYKSPCLIYIYNSHATVGGAGVNFPPSKPPPPLPAAIDRSHGHEFSDSLVGHGCSSFLVVFGHLRQDPDKYLLDLARQHPSRRVLLACTRVARGTEGGGV